MALKDLQDTKVTAEVDSIAELNKYLDQGWVLILSYVKTEHGANEPRFVVAWQHSEPAVHPEILDRWEERELRRQRSR